jgi:hypothetical protein
LLHRSFLFFGDRRSSTGSAPGERCLIISTSARGNGSPWHKAPASLPDFRVGGFSNSDWDVTQMDVTNSSGNQTNYTIYRLRNIQTGSSISLQVK